MHVASPTSLSHVHHQFLALLPPFELLFLCDVPGLRSGPRLYGIPKALLLSLRPSLVKYVLCTFDFSLCPVSLCPLTLPKLNLMLHLGLFFRAYTSFSALAHLTFWAE